MASLGRAGRSDQGRLRPGRGRRTLPRRAALRPGRGRGAVRPGHNRAHEGRGGPGRVASLAATGTDARRAERRLAEEEERLRLTVESLADYAIVGLDPSGRIVGWNRGAEQIFGYPAAEILGADFSALFTVEDRGRGVPEAELRSAAASGRGEDGRWHLRRDGSRFYAAGFVVPALDAAGALRGDTKIARDETRQQRTQEALRAVEVRYRALVTASSSVVWATDAAGSFVQELPSWADFTGQSPAEYMGWGWSEAIHPEERDRIVAQWRAAVQAPSTYEAEGYLRAMADNIPQLAWMADPEGSLFWYIKRRHEYTVSNPEAMRGWGWQTVHDPAELPRVVAKFRDHVARGEPWEDTFPLRRHDGQFRWHLSRALPVADDRRRVALWFGTNTDITELRDLEQALKEADRRKDEFLATLAHELRNPLAPIRNGLQIMRLAAGDPAAVEEARALIERQVAHMVRLIDDLMDVSRITRGSIELRRERVDLAAVVRAALDTSRPLVEAAGHALELIMPAGPIPIDGDPTRPGCRRPSATC